MKDSVARFYWSHLASAHQVLDLGCASGDLGLHKPIGTRVFGLEINPDLVTMASQHEEALAWNLDSSEPLPFSDAYFDAVVAKDILEHLQKPWRTLAEVRRVLKPGGIVLASVICYRDKRIWNDYTHVRGFTMNSLRNMFRDAGFKVVDVWRMGGVPLSSRLNFIHIVPLLLRFPPFDWLWTSSYEIKARRPL
jgi:SAM-dependent methyltransferase